MRFPGLTEAIWQTWLRVSAKAPQLRGGARLLKAAAPPPPRTLPKQARPEVQQLQQALKGFAKLVGDGVFKPLSSGSAGASRFNPAIVVGRRAQSSAYGPGSRIVHTLRSGQFATARTAPYRVNDVGLRCARNFSSGPATNLVSQAPLALRALVDLDFDRDVSDRKGKAVRRFAEYAKTSPARNTSFVGGCFYPAGEVQGPGGSSSLADITPQAEYNMYFDSERVESHSLDSERVARHSSVTASPATEYHTLWINLEPDLTHSLSSSESDLSNSYILTGSSHMHESSVLFDYRTRLEMARVQNAYAEHSRQLHGINVNLSRAGIFESRDDVQIQMEFDEQQKRLRITFDATQWSRRDILQAIGDWDSASSTALWTLDASSDEPDHVFVTLSDNDSDSWEPSDSGSDFDIDSYSHLSVASLADVNALWRESDDHDFIFPSISMDGSVLH